MKGFWPIAICHNLENRTAEELHEKRFSGDDDDEEEEVDDDADGDDDDGDDIY